MMGAVAINPFFIFLEVCNMHEILLSIMPDISAIDTDEDKCTLFNS